jgi:hypothetical protein
MTSTKTLHDRIEFDCPFRVDENGDVTPAHDVLAPELFDEEISPGWEMLNGYSGQDSYCGPIMHNAEYVAGALERDILATPGVYCLVAAQWESEDDEDGGDCIVDGWAVARRVDATPGDYCGQCGRAGSGDAFGCTDACRAST